MSGRGAVEDDVRGHTAAQSVRGSATLPSAWRADCRSLRSHALSPAIYVGRHSGSNYCLCAWRRDEVQYSVTMTREEEAD